MNLLKKIGIGMAASAVMTAMSLPSIVANDPKTTLPFDDIHNSYAKQEIIELHQQGIVQGKGEGKFEPATPITRAEFVAMLLRTLRIEPLRSDIPAFHDVPKASWAYPWIQTGIILEITNGKSNTVFAPGDHIQRQEAAALLVRALFPNAKLSSEIHAFKDASQVSSWAKPYVQEVQRQGLMKGYQGSFRPTSALTRQEIAVILHRVIHNQPESIFGTAPAKPEIHMVWQYAETGEAFKKRIESSKMVNVVSPRWFFLNKNGTLSDHADPSFVSWIHNKGLQVWVLVGNRFDRETTSRLLNDESASMAVVQQIRDYAMKYRLDGINIDFENIHPNDRDRFTSFIKNLSQALKEEGIVLSVDVPPNLGTDWSDPFDYRALGEHADYVVMMGYDEHWNGGPKAGSVSSYPWLERGVDRLLQDIPADKFIVGVPFYSRTWSVQSGKIFSKDLTIHEQNALVHRMNSSISWDPKIKQYIASYTQNGVKHTIWMEDSRSLAQKYRMARGKGIAGLAYWYAGGETSDVWNTLDYVRKYTK